MMGLNAFIIRRTPKGDFFATDETETTGSVRDATYPKQTHVFAQTRSTARVLQLYYCRPGFDRRVWVGQVQPGGTVGGLPLGGVVLIRYIL